MKKDGHIALVTGSNRGIGLETCRQLAQQGLTVILTSRDPDHGVEATEKLRKEGLRVVVRPLDVSDRASIGALEEFVAAEFGRLDALINTAAVYLDEGVSVFEVTEELFRESQKKDNFLK